MKYVLVRSSSFVELHHRLETELLKAISVHGIDYAGKETFFTNGGAVCHLFTNVSVDEVRSVLAHGEEIDVMPINDADVLAKSPNFKIHFSKKFERVTGTRSTTDFESESSKLAKVCVSKEPQVEMKETVKPSTDLIVPINYRGIEYIKIPENLFELIIKMNESATTEERDAPYCCIRPSRPELGHMSKSATSIEFFGCKSIKEELNTLAMLHPGIPEWDVYSEFKALGLVHTMQYPLGKLKMKGFINEDQFSLINNFIKNKINVVSRLDKTSELESKKIVSEDPLPTKSLVEVSLFSKADSDAQAKAKDAKLEPKRLVVTGVPFR